MKALKILSLAASAFLLVGCETVKTVVVTKHVWKTTSIDTSYLKDCQVEKLPERDLYSKMSQEEREDALARMVIAQNGHLKNCSIDKRVVKNAIDRQNRLIQELNDREEKRVQEERKNLEK